MNSKASRMDSSDELIGSLQPESSAVPAEGNIPERLRVVERAYNPHENAMPHEIEALRTEVGSEIPPCVAGVLEKSTISRHQLYDARKAFEAWKANVGLSNGDRIRRAS